MSTTIAPTGVALPRLPPELWLLIFRFATSAPIISPSEFTYHYEPFQSRHHRISTACFDATLRVKCAIVSVCRQWHALAGDMRYEDIRIRRGIAALYAALTLTEPAPAPAATAVGSESSTATGTIAARHYVRRAVLPYAHAEKPSYHTPSALALLALLPHLEVLVRPPLPMPGPSRRQRRVRVPIPIPTTPTAAPALPTLRRLEWAFEGRDLKAHTSGIDFLIDILAAAPSLHELVLIGPIPYNAPVSLRKDRLHLPALRTLRLHDGAGTCPRVAEQTTYWELPSLETVVVEGHGNAQWLGAIWQKFGGQVRRLELELGGGWRGGASIGDVSKIVAACPALEELNLRVVVEDSTDWSPMHPDDVAWSCTHNTLQRIGICIHDVDDECCSAVTWMKVVEFTGKFVKGCPALHQVVLYVEDVEVALQNSRFHEFRETLSSSGRELLLHSVHA